MKDGNGGAQAGKGLISPRHNEIKEHGAIQTLRVPCQLCSSLPTTVTDIFFCRSKVILFTEMVQVTQCNFYIPV